MFSHLLRVAWDTHVFFKEESIKFEQEDYHLKDHDYLVTSNLGMY